MKKSAKISLTKTPKISLRLKEANWINKNW